MPRAPCIRQQPGLVVINYLTVVQSYSTRYMVRTVKSVRTMFMVVYDIVWHDLVRMQLELCCWCTLRLIYLEPGMVCLVCQKGVSCYLCVASSWTITTTPPPPPTAARTTTTPTAATATAARATTTTPSPNKNYSSTPTTTKRPLIKQQQSSSDNSSNNSSNTNNEQDDEWS